ncbi:HAD-IB family hydrolase, partial [Candidatus Parcubacteria bacterium]|nr:HAD-IB family hydrolase [Candidatus Parcubacteria bacterium]
GKGLYLWFFMYKIGLVRDPKKAMEYAFMLFKGKSLPEMDALVSRFVEVRLRPLFYRKALEKIRDHRERGAAIVLVSNAIEPLARHIGKEVGADAVIATELEREGERYTGKLLEAPMYGETKARKVLEFVRQRGFSLDDSWGYGDHGSDIPVLKLTAHPVAVNPDRALRAASRRLGWSTLSFRE